MVLVYLSMIEGPEDRNKFEIVYQQYKSLMYYVAYRILREERDAEDAVHNAFVRIAEHIEKISEPVCPKTPGPPRGRRKGTRWPGPSPPCPTGTGN